VPAFTVIRISGRLPGAANPAALWRNLPDGIESIAFLCDEELLEVGRWTKQRTARY
jgi:acyl transferase domain-containing protein